MSGFFEEVKRRKVNDALEGPQVTQVAAEIHAIFGDAGQAKLDPVWDSIRNDLRFQALIDNYGAKA
jgi:hypothetical protein